jgi:hypothetical protein
MQPTPPVPRSDGSTQSEKQLARIETLPRGSNAGHLKRTEEVCEYGDSGKRWYSLSEYRWNAPNWRQR